MSATTLDSIIEDILFREGWPKVTNRAADDGGLTKGGITFENYNRWRKSQGRTPMLPTAFPELTRDAAVEFILSSIAGPFYSLQDLDVRLFALMFDWAMTSGPDDPTKALQSSIRALGGDVVVDGTFGIKTRVALEQKYRDGARELIYKLVAKQRVLFYIKVALNDDGVRQFRAANPTDLDNINGWVTRALEFL